MQKNWSFKKQHYGRKSRLFFISLLCLIYCCIPQFSYAEEKPQNKLPTSPDTGTPEENFSAGGTRENSLVSTACGETTQSIVYLLGEKNREYTLAAHPIFWFYIPHFDEQKIQMRLVLKELATEKTIYDRPIPKPEKAGITGIALPQEEQYALSPEVNYSWSLQVNCHESDEEFKLALEGWLHRLSPDSNIENQLVNASPTEQYQIYLEQELLYDALTEIAQRRIAEPENSEIATQWNQLLAELGWQDLVQQQSAIAPYILDLRIFTKK